MEEGIMKFRLTSPYGELSLVHPKPHTGIDLAMPEGTPLRSVVNGVVEKIVDYGNENIGKGVIIAFEDGKKAIYGHMSDVTVKVGDKLNYGDLIGYSGNTGHSTGPHLHFGIKDGNRFIDPSEYEKNLQEICGSWAHVNVGETQYAFGIEDTDIDIVDFLLGLVKIMLI